MTASVGTHAPPRSNAGTAITVLVVGVALLLGIFSSTAWSLVEIWSTSHLYGHGFLIVPIMLFLVWRKRAALAETDVVPFYWGIPFIAFGALVWLLGNIASINMVEQFAFVSLIVALVLTVAGLQVFMALAFPLFFLVFAVPFGGFLIPPLQLFTADFAVSALQLSGIPVYLDGLMIHIPSGRFHVAEACSGARFLISSTVLGFLVAHLFYRQLWRRALFVGISVVVPIIANGFRAFGIVILAHETDHEVAVGADHITFGLIFLSIVIFLVLAIGASFREKNGPDLFLDDVGKARESKRLVSAAPALVFALIASLALPVVARGYSSLDLSGGDIIARPQLVAPTIAGWRAEEPRSPWNPDFPRADAVLHREFTDGANRLDLFVAYYTHQRQGAEVTIQNDSLSGGGDGAMRWIAIGAGTADIVVEEQPLKVQTSRAMRGDQGRLNWQWYWVAGEFTASRPNAKFLETKARLFGRSPPAALVVLSADYDETPDEAAAVMLRFLESGDAIRSMLESVSGQ